MVFIIRVNMRKVIQFISVLLVAVLVTVPVCAATKSPTQSGAPAVISPAQNGAPVAEVKATVTPLVELDKAPAEVKAAMEAANEALAEGDLSKVAAVTTALAENKSEVKAENLVVSDLFYVSVEENANKEVTLTFKVSGIKAGQYLMVMVFIDGEWVVIDEDKVLMTKDGEVTVTFDQVGPVAFIVEKV